MNTFKVNEKEYKAKPFDYNLVCDLEDMGVSMSQVNGRPMSMVRAYFALCAGLSAHDAGKEMEAHIVCGGKFDDITNAMTVEMDKSDFFHSLSKATEAEITEDPIKAKAK